MFAALNIDRNNISNAVADDMLDDIGITRVDYNLGQTISRVGFLVAELPSQLISKRSVLGCRRRKRGLTSAVLALICGSLSKSARSVSSLRCSSSLKEGLLFWPRDTSLPRSRVALSLILFCTSATFIQARACRSG